MSEQEKKWQRIYDLLNTKTKPKFLCLLYRKQRNIFFLLKKSILMKMREWRIKQKQKENFLTAFAPAIKKDPTTSIRKHANKYKVLKKTVRTAIKVDLSPDHNLLITLYEHRKQNECNFPSKYWFA